MTERLSPPLGACDAPLPIPGASSVLDALPQRRSVRLAGWYFVTIVARERAPLFEHITPEAQLQPTLLGELVRYCWHELSTRYDQLHADCWVLMPDHVHLLVGLLPTTPRVPAKSLGQLVGAFKATCTRLSKPLQPSTASIWQRNYHEHVIRTATDLASHRQYVRDNPRRWLEKQRGATL